MLDNKLLIILYCILIPYVVLLQFCNCTKVKDSYLEATSSSDYLLYNSVYPATLKTSIANINKEKYDDIELNIRKISNEEINRDTANTNNLLQSNIKYPIENEADTYNNNNRKKYNEEDKFGSNVLSTTESYSFEDMVANHRKYLHMTFEKHKAQSLKNLQYNQEHKHVRLNRNNISQDNQNYHSNNNSHSRDTKNDAFQTTFIKQNEPYYHEKLYYNGDKNPIENNPFTLYSKIKKSHKNTYLEKYHNHHNKQQHHYHHHHHHHHHHQHNLNKQNSNKWPHLSRIQSEFYYDENNGQKDEDLLPPYIKKYNRRNKQLKNLLEGTSLQTQHSRKHHHNQQKMKSIEYFGKIKSDNLKQHLRNHKKNPKWIIENLFEEQRSNPNNPNSNNDDNTDSTTIFTNNSTKLDIDTMLKENKFPDDSASAEHYDNYDYNEEKLSPVNKSRMINEQKNSQIHDFKDSFKPKTFIYHRVDDPRIVGAGDTGKKQRLPFVAITDRRLETSKRLKPTNFELNNFPLP